MKIKPTPLKILLHWIRERYSIYVKRNVDKLPAPWTSDPILQSYRFCNVYREHDRVTAWLAQNWRTPNEDDDMLWFAMCVARLLNRTESLAAIGYPVPFRKTTLNPLRKLEAEGGKVFGAAYIVSTGGRPMNKLDHIQFNVLQPMWDNRKRITDGVINAKTLEEVYGVIGSNLGFGSFMAAQVVADLKYVKRMRNMPDWYTFASIGPGSRRGMNRLLGIERLNQRIRIDVWLKLLEELRLEVNEQLKHVLPEPLHAQDLQNCLCEFDKYMRVRNEEGRPKQKFDGGLREI